MNWEMKANELREKADRIDYLSQIYAKVERDMQWEAMKSHDPDEEHEDLWFTAPNEDDTWLYPKYCTYMEVLDAIEKLVK